MKKFLMLCLMAVMCVGAMAQNNPNRMLVVENGGRYKGYAVDRVDSIIFKTVEGRVAADLEFKSFNNDAAKPVVTIAVTKTAQCSNFRITVVTKTLANAITTDVAAANYFDQIGGATYSEDFTNAEMSGFEFEFVPGAEYTVMTMGYDKYGVAGSVSKVSFKVPDAPVVGNPTVTCTVTDVQSDKFSVKFTPNADCGEYYICVFEKGTAQQQFEQWGPMMGFARIEDMIKQFSGKGYGAEYTNEWTSMTPGTEYEVYVLPCDANGTYAPMIIVPVTTLKLGGEGTAEVTITKGEFKDVNGKKVQSVIFTPNDQTAFFRDVIIKKASFDEAWGSDEAVIEYLKGDDPYNPYWNLYSTDEWPYETTSGEVNIAYAIAQNSKGEWGPLAKLEVTSPTFAPANITSAPQFSNGVVTREVNNVKQNGVSPFLHKKNVKKGLQLIEK